MIISIPRRTSDLLETQRQHPGSIHVSVSLAFFLPTFYFSFIHSFQAGNKSPASSTGSKNENGIENEGMR